MNVREEAIKQHANGFNCAQSVLMACREYTGMDEQTTLAVSAGFGGGLRCGEVCGAVSGGVMALGLTHPFVDPKDHEAKDRIATLAKNFAGAFRKEFGCLRCGELKGDKSNCPQYIEFAALLAESMIKNEK